MEASLYIHVPFCTHKCAYCSFFSVPRDGGERSYLPLLVRELSGLEDLGVEAPTLYIGGGTPSCMEAGFVEGLMAAVRQSVRLRSGAEVTCEANPETFTPALAERWALAGVNRISLGAQSLEDGVLAAMGRGHRGADVPRAVEAARKAGIENISLDLIYGYPGQTLAGWEETLKGILELDVPHLSCYALTVEEGTPLARGLALGTLALEEESQADMGDLAVSMLHEAGYRRYEISNFAKPGQESRHNTVYWERKPYLGIGAGAHGYLWEKGGWFRYFHANDLGAYREELETAPEKRFPNRGYLSRAERMFEAVMLSTRMARGLDRTAFCREFGIRVEDAYPGVIQPLLEGNLLMERGEYLALTPRGMDLQNGILMKFMRDC